MDEDLVQLLIIEDNREYSFLIREYIEMARPGLFKVESVERLAAGLERLMQEPVDLVLLDLTLPDSQGMETFLAVHASAPEVPVVVLTGHDDERTAMEAAREGAQDYLVKGEVSGDLLVRCMLSAIERHQVREKLTHYARMLEASEARFRGVIENSSDGIAIVDREGRLRFLNRSAEVMLGRRADEMLDRVFGVPAREDQSMEIDVLRPESEPAVALLRAVESRWDGDPASILTLRDVTGRERLRALETQLEEEGLLIQHLRELDRMKDEFVQTVTHELRTPMTPLQSAVEMFLDGTLGELQPAQREMLELMARNIQRLSRFATDVLVLSRLDRDEFPISCRELNLLPTVRPSIELLRKRAEEKGMTLTLDGDVQGRVVADPDAAAQIVTNLLDNAITHNPEGTAIRVSVEAGDADVMILTVADDGVGVSAEARARLFDRFYQVARRSGPGYRGTGIGLAVCKGLVDRMGGSVSVESRPGEGTTFRIALRTPAPSSDLLFGRIAVALGYLSTAQVDAAVAAQPATATTPIGELLMAGGLLDRSERDEILATQRRRMSEPHPRVAETPLGDGLMGQILVARGYLTDGQLHHCLRKKQALEGSGDAPRLGSLLVGEGLVSRDGILEALVAQGQRLLLCPDCGGRFNSFAAGGALSVRCPRCGAGLGEEGAADSIEVDGDVLA
jgi:signal transduction histidine kinase